MSSLRRFSLARDADVGLFLTGVGRRTTLEPESTQVVTRTIFDTFDWRLFQGGSLIELHVEDDADAVIVWRSFATGAVLARFELAAVPRFAWDLEPGSATSRLAEIIEMRALLPLATFVTRRTTMRQLDDEDKTIARVVADEVIGSAARPLAPVVSVIPLRGYDAEAGELTELLDAQVVLTGDADDLMVAALRSEGYAPGSYSSKLRAKLRTEDPASTAWITVLRALLGAMRANEAGTRDDLDSEFLHDFRVAVRRTRSVLGEASGIFPAAALDHFRTEFKWLGQVTSPTRDLDVFLLDTVAFQDELPAERQPDLKAFLGFLEGRQRHAHLDLVADLERARYATLIDEWSRFLDDPPAPTADEPQGSQLASEIAAARIAQAHRRLVKRGRRIDHTSEPERLHDLRKDAKRLRYLFECFGSLFPAELTGPIVKELKGVQDVLGTYQDCQVQAGQLEQFAQEMLEQDNVAASAVMIIGLLVEQLDRRAVSARDGFADRFAGFDRREVRAEVRQLDPNHHHDAPVASDPVATSEPRSAATGRSDAGPETRPSEGPTS